MSDKILYLLERKYPDYLSMTEITEVLDLCDHDLYSTGLKDWVRHGKVEEVKEGRESMFRINNLAS